VSGDLQQMQTWVSTHKSDAILALKRIHEALAVLGFVCARQSYFLGLAKGL
jgi:hypothetical protein